MPPKAPKVKTPHGGTEKPNTDHSYSQRNTRGITSVDIPTGGSESEELDSFKCYDCKKTIYTNDTPVQCDFCDNVYCYKCSDISSKAQYKKLCIVAKEEDATMWFCKHCRTSVLGVKKMTIRVTKVEETQSHVLKRLDNLEKTTEGIDEKIEVAMQEQREMDVRKLSIMCFGLKETTDDDHADDTSNLKHIIYDVLEIPEDDDDIKPIRIGQLKPNKVRPLRFEAKAFVGKKKLLQMARIKLKGSSDPELKELFLKPDLTKKQRAEAFAKRESRRSENAEGAAIEDGGGGRGPFPGSQPQ